MNAFDVLIKMGRCFELLKSDQTLVRLDVFVDRLHVVAQGGLLPEEDLTNEALERFELFMNTADVFLQIFGVKELCRTNLAMMVSLVFVDGFFVCL